MKNQILPEGRYCVVRLGDRLHFRFISDNLKTCIRCFELSDGADMMNILDEAGTGILELKVAHITTVLRDYFRQLKDMYTVF